MMFMIQTRYASVMCLFILNVIPDSSLLILFLNNDFILQINFKIKIVSGSPCGAVAAEAKKAQAGWVVLDK